MSDLSHAFRRRLLGLGILLACGVVACTALAVTMARRTNRTVERLADIELEAAVLARQFRAGVDDLHSALLAIGSDPPSDSRLAVGENRKRLEAWLAARLRAADTREERALLERLGAELRSYIGRLDEIVGTSRDYTQPIGREMIAQSDTAAVRLQSMADEFAALHDLRLRDLLAASLDAVSRLRDLVFLCLGLLLVAMMTLVGLLYRDVVRPLRAQLVESEKLLEQREKLAALGTLAAGVAHEIRNPLTAIKARLYTLRRMQTEPEATKDTDSIRLEIERLERIVRDVLGYARPANPKLSLVELATWLREFGAAAEAQIRSKEVEVAIVEPPAEAHVQADVDQLRQILLNLVRNAEDAFEGRRGRIELALQRERSALKGAVKDVAVLSVTDNGPGIPADIQPRLFDPFFTTKSNGTGLGLSIVGRLVENQGGEIVFQTAPRKGTRFSVRLPIRNGAAHSART